MINTSGTHRIEKLNKETLANLVSRLQQKGYNTLVLNNEEEVFAFIKNLPGDVIIGLGDSVLNCSLKIRNLLAEKGSLLYYGWDGDSNFNRSLETFETHPTPGYFLSRISAITLNGDILIRDYSKDAMLHNNFPEKMVAFCGSNRIVEDFDEEPSLVKYSVFREKPENVDFKIVILPFMVY